MNRLKFLETLLVLPAGVFLVHCSSDSSSGYGSYGSYGGGTGAAADSPAAAPTKSGAQDVYTSSVAGGHHHTFSIDDGAFSSPPASGVTGDSSVDSGHSHAVTVSADQLAQVGMGQTLKVASTSVGGHSHVFTFLKIA